MKCDSINKATLRMNEETVQANYRIQKALSLIHIYSITEIRIMNMKAYGKPSR